MCLSTTPACLPWAVRRCAGWHGSQREPAVAVHMPLDLCMHHQLDCALVCLPTCLPACLPLVVRQRQVTEDGLELHIQTNHLSHFLLTLGLLPALHRGAKHAAQHCSGFVPRVVHVSSAMHALGYRLRHDPLMTQQYDVQLAYGSSKLAQARLLPPRLPRAADALLIDVMCVCVRACSSFLMGAPDALTVPWPDAIRDVLLQVVFSAELNRRLAAAADDAPSVASLALHPGNVLTDVVRSLPAPVRAAYRALLSRVLLSPAEGAGIFTSVVQSLPCGLLQKRCTGTAACMPWMMVISPSLTQVHGRLCTLLQWRMLVARMLLQPVAT